MMMRIDRVMVRGGMIVQISNVATDVHHFVEMTIDRRAQRCAMTTTQDSGIEKRIRVGMIESIARTHAQSTDERAFGTR